MATRPASGLDLVELRRLFAGGILGGLTDGQLLERFVAREGEDGKAAFEFLLERHGPMVLRVCNQALKDRHQAEDAFQATFLVLARQAGSIRNRDSVGSWLFGVARRAARRIRRDEARRRQHERRSQVHRSGPWTLEQESTEHWPELHVAIERLPAKYREPIVLCYLEGFTHEQAASLLCWPVGTVKTRLARARECLRRRLIGLDRAGPSALPQGLLGSTINAVLRDAARPGAAGAGAVSSAVTTITEGILKWMWLDRLRLTGITLVALIAAAGLGASIVAQQVAGTGRGSVVAGAQGEPADKSGSQQVLQLVGTTDLDPATVTIVRSQFDCRIDKVFVDLGSTVKKGDPLMELFSTDLAEAKNDFETTRSQHNRDLKVLNSKAPLVKAGNLPAKELIEVEKDEAKTRFAMKVARDKLLIFGLTEEEIGKVAREDGIQKARRILRSRSDGILIKRAAVVGNYYSTKDELMQIAVLDHLWVRGGVSEQDADKVKLGQKINIVFPYTQQTVDAKVEFIDKTIEPETRSVKFRTSIPNHEGRFKACMFVRMLLEIPPTPSRTAEQGTAASKAPGMRIQERLENLKPKLELLLKANADQTATATFEAHLGALEQELDLLVKEATGK